MLDAHPCGVLGLSAVHWVMASMNTRSKKSSSGLAVAQDHADTREMLDGARPIRPRERSPGAAGC